MAHCRKIITDGNGFVTGIHPTQQKADGKNILPYNDPRFSTFNVHNDFMDEFGNLKLKWANGSFTVIKPTLTIAQSKLKKDRQIQIRIREEYTEQDERDLRMKGVEDKTDSDYVEYKNRITQIKNEIINSI